DIIQGPLARIFGLSSLRIQTAGYSAQAPAELVLAGIVNPEEIRDIIMGHVHSQSPLAVETYGGSRSEGASIREIHGELVRIRTLLEEGQKR
ncbi:MAG: PH domain-containing protein, partial [Methanoregulaceae archaeon]